MACAFVEGGPVTSWCLNRTRPGQMTDAAREFAAMWSSATAVMGHNIRRHDLKILNGWMVMLGLPLLESRPMIDTLRDLPRTAGFSRGLENICARWGCPIQKVWVPEHMWELANDGIQEGVDLVRVRVETDVAMNLWLYREEKRRGLL